MPARVTQRRRVKDEGPLGRKLLLQGNNESLQAIVNVPCE